MKHRVNSFRQGLTDAMYLHQIFHPGTGDALQTTELLEQLLAPLRSQADDLFQRA